MSTTSQLEQHEFQAEVRQLLDIVIHSLYTDKEIFVRELISNASDALERARFHQVSGQKLQDENLELRIAVSTSPDDKTLTIEDTGSGMTRDELVENLGTIAHSGSKTFLKQLAEAKDKKASVDLIGQFGVGFYSAFMVAKGVKVYTRSWAEGEEGWCWSSDGSGKYTIESQEGLRRGTKIVVELKEEDSEFSQDYRVEGIIRQYSNFVSFPIELNGKAVNTQQAIWTRSKTDLKEEDYHAFYKYVGHDHEDPKYYLHFTADAPLAIKALLYVPQKNIEKLGFSRLDSQVNLHCRKVLIQSGAKDLLPEWLRFVKGVVDSEDLPLNISRESMQDSSLIQKLNKVLTGRFLKFLDEESKKRPEKYEAFYGEFSVCLKEGVMSDFAHREPLAKLLRFESSNTEAGKKTSLSDYVSRMKSGQEEIFYVTAPNRTAAEASPYYEVFKAKGLEVLFLMEGIDEFVMDHLREFEGKKLKAAEKAELALDDDESKKKMSDDDARLLANFIKETLGDRVGDVKVSKRLVDSPVVVVDSDEHMTASMRQMLKAIHRDDPSQLQNKKLHLEINPSHAIMVNLQKASKTDKDLAAKATEQLLDNALMAAGLLEDPRSMLKRMDELLEKVLEPA